MMMAVTMAIVRCVCSVAPRVGRVLFHQTNPERDEIAGTIMICASVQQLRKAGTARCDVRVVGVRMTLERRRKATES